MLNSNVNLQNQAKRMEEMMRLCNWLCNFTMKSSRKSCYCQGKIQDFAKGVGGHTGTVVTVQSAKCWGMLSQEKCTLNLNVVAVFIKILLVY